MAAIRLYLDEGVHTFIADALRRRGWEAVTTDEAGRGEAMRDNLVYLNNWA